jgi:hypothetical protein
VRECDDDNNIMIDDDVVSKRRCFSPETQNSSHVEPGCSSKRENLASFFEEHRTAQQMSRL